MAKKRKAKARRTTVRKRVSVRKTIKASGKRLKGKKRKVNRRTRVKRWAKRNSGYGVSAAVTGAYVGLNVAAVALTVRSIRRGKGTPPPFMPPPGSGYGSGYNYGRGRGRGPGGTVMGPSTPIRPRYPWETKAESLGLIIERPGTPGEGRAASAALGRLTRQQENRPRIGPAQMRFKKRR